MLSIKLNLSKLKKASLTNLKGKSGEIKKCLVIPVEDAGLFIGREGVYLDLTAFPLRERRFDQSHIVKQSIDRDTFNNMTDEEKNSLPILGGIKEFARPEMQPTNDYTFDNTPNDDLPF